MMCSVRICSGSLSRKYCREMYNFVICSEEHSRSDMQLGLPRGVTVFGGTSFRTLERDRFPVF